MSWTVSFYCLLFNWNYYYFMMLPEMEFHLGTLNYCYMSLGYISLSFSIFLVLIFSELRKNRKFLLQWWVTGTSASYYLRLISLPLNRQKKKGGEIWNGGFIWKQTEICIVSIYICASFTCQSNYFKSPLYRIITCIIRNTRKVYFYRLLYKEGKWGKQMVNSKPVSSVSMVSALFPVPKDLSAFSCCSELLQW